MVNKTISKVNVLLATILVALVIIVGGLLMLPSSPMPAPILVSSALSVTKLPGSTAKQMPANTLVSPQLMTEVLPTNTLVPLQHEAEALSTQTDLRQSAVATPHPMLTEEVASPTLPAVQIISPAAGSASSGDLVVQEDHTPDGMYLTLSGGRLSAIYRLGPLARGAYALGPNNLFLVYITNAGQIFGLRLGEDYFVQITDLKHVLGTSIKNTEPAYRLAFSDREFVMFLIVYEDVFRQKIAITLPREITY